MSTNSTPSKGGLSRAGSFLKRLMFEESSLDADNRRVDERTPVVGEVNVVVLDSAGNPAGQTRGGIL